MSDGWKTALLSELCDLKPPKGLARSMLEDDDNVSFVPMSDLGELEKRFEVKEVRRFKDVVNGYTYFGDGDVLCAKITPCFENGKLGVATGLANGVGFGSSEFVVMRSKGDLIPDYLFYYLSRDEFRKTGERVMSGAVGHKRVPRDFFEDLEVPLPPLDEQKRIVAKLDQAFAALNRARANAEEHQHGKKQHAATSAAGLDGGCGVVGGNGDGFGVKIGAAEQDVFMAAHGIYDFFRLFEADIKGFAEQFDGLDFTAVLGQSDNLGQHFTGLATLTRLVA